jgi:hypothetical protein
MTPQQTGGIFSAPAFVRVRIASLRRVTVFGPLNVHAEAGINNHTMIAAVC